MSSDQITPSPFQITVQPSARTFTAEVGETILAAAIRQGIGMPFDPIEDPVDDPPGRFFRKATDAFDPARSDVGRETVAVGKVERSVKGGLPIKASGVLTVIQDQFVDPFIAVGGIRNEGILQVAFDLDGLGRELRVKLPKDPSGKKIQVAGNIDMVEMDQPRDQIRIRRACLVVHPAANNIIQNIPVQEAVDCDHDPVP